MIILLITISIILGAIILIFCDDNEMVYVPMLGLVIKIGVLVYILIQLIGCKVIDEKIELYQNQNKEIESKVELVVKQYMKHENETFKDLKIDESYITLVTLYPELKSDKLIMEEINLYEENNSKITALKEQKINEKIYKWWLYFGG